MVLSTPNKFTQPKYISMSFNYSSECEFAAVDFSYFSRYTKFWKPTFLVYKFLYLRIIKYTVHVSVTAELISGTVALTNFKY